MAVKRPNPKKDKSARRRRGGPGPGGRGLDGGRGSVLTAQGLVDGVALADGVQIRLARVGDVEVARRLIALVGSGVSLEAEMVAAVEAGRVGAAVLQGLSEGPEALTRLLAVGVHEGEGSMQDVLAGLTSMLVADHPVDGVVGVLLALPPAAALSHTGLPEMEALVGLVKVIKLKAVAVDAAHRGAGIGAALVRTSCRLYAQLGYAMMYGQFRMGSGLEAYYQRLGFAVLDKGAGFQLPMFSVPFGIRTEPGEQIFVRDLN
jgi:GNAT superfamily N-acetyltransferase